MSRRAWKGRPGPFGRATKSPFRVAAIFVGLSLAACDGSSATQTRDERPDTLVVMTYNIFHDGERERHGIAPWPERRQGVVDLIRSRSPDVVGLQEAESWQIDWLLEQMPEFDAVARAVVADADDENAETVGILYLRERLELADAGHFWYSETPDQPGSQGAAEFGDLDGPRMATWARLRPAGAPDGFYVFNTHFTADEHAAEPEVARVRSAELLVDRIEARAHPDESFFVTGDLNATPASSPVLYLLGRLCEEGGACAASSAARMIDTWAALHSGDTGAGTRCVAGSSSDGPRIDYVFVWDPPEAQRPSVLDAEIVKDGAGCPSDHRPVVARVVIP